MQAPFTMVRRESSNALTRASDHPSSDRWKQYAEIRRSLRRDHPLRYLFIELTRRCNFNCVYCGSDCSISNRSTELSGQQWKNALSQIANDFDSKSVMVAVTGGEPLLYRDAFEIFSYLKELGFPFGMVTNGSLLDAKTAQRLVKSGMGSISISLDAPPALNDTLRGRDSARKTERAIDNLKTYGYRGILEIISTITKPVVGSLDELRRYIARLRVARWRVAPVMPIGRAANRPDLLLDTNDLRTLLEFTLSGRKDGYRPIPEMSEEGFLGERYEGEVRPYLCRCDAGITIGGIMCDGRIGACPELPEAFIQGHILRDRFIDVWNGRYKNLRDRSWTRKNACASCDAFDICSGGALHLYQNTSSDIARCLYLMLQEH
jgi:radical SAM protein with 4Fe4S-binding SPASM domain